MKLNYTFCFVLSLLFLNITSTKAQFSIGPKINLGMGRINSKNMIDNMNARNIADSKINTWSVNNKYGFAYGLGVFIQYNFNDNFSILAEPTYGALKHSITIDYQDNKLDNNGDGDITTISSESTIKLSYFSLPILAKYSFKGQTGLYVIAGLDLFFTGSPTIQSSETETKVHYKSNAVDKTDISYRAASATLDIFQSPRTSFVLGVGVAIDLGGKNLNIDARYHLPLTKSTMYTTDANYHAYTFKSNAYFDLWGKIEAESDAPQFQLNDFKMGLIEISIGYTLFKSN